MKTLQCYHFWPHVNFLQFLWKDFSTQLTYFNSYGIKLLFLFVLDSFKIVQESTVWWNLRKLFLQNQHFVEGRTVDSGRGNQIVGRGKRKFLVSWESTPSYPPTRKHPYCDTVEKTFLREETFAYFRVFGQNCKITFLFWCWIARIRSGKIFQNWWITKMTSWEILYTFMNYNFWVSFISNAFWIASSPNHQLFLSVVSVKYD